MKRSLALLEVSLIVPFALLLAGGLRRTGKLLVRRQGGRRRRQRGDLRLDSL